MLGIGLNLAQTDTCQVTWPMRWMKYLRSKWDPGLLDGLRNLGFGISVASLVASLIEPRINWEAGVNEEFSWSCCLVHMSVGNYLVYLTGTGSIIPWLGDLNWARAEKSSLVPGMRTFTLPLLLEVLWLVSLHPCLGFPTVMNSNCNLSVSWSFSGCFNHRTEMKSGQEWTHVLIPGLFFSLLYTVFFFFFRMCHIECGLEAEGTW